MDPRLPLQGAWVQSLVWKLRSHKPCSAAKKEKKTKYKLKKKRTQLLFSGTTHMFKNCYLLCLWSVYPTGMYKDREFVLPMVMLTVPPRHILSPQ